MRGRKPTPTHLRELRGNPGKRPLNHHEPRPEVRAPPCPRELSPAAKREWRRVARQLSVMKLVTDFDRAILAVYCQAYAFWAEAVVALRKYGIVIKSPSGFPMQSPYVAIANKQAELMSRVAVEFGFTPSSRSRIVVRPRPFPHEPEPGSANDDDDQDLDAYFASRPGVH
jgi:P27 family predicted phage terminase small subunit